LRISLFHYLIRQLISAVILGLIGGTFFWMALNYTQVNGKYFCFAVSGILNVCALCVFFCVAKISRLIFFKEVINKFLISGVVPFKKNFQIQVDKNSDAWMVFFLENVSNDLLKGRIVLYNGLMQQVLINLIEPKSFQELLTNERRWRKSIGHNRHPMIVRVPFLAVAPEINLLEIKLEWNFQGTYLQKLIPISNKVHGEIIIVNGRR
jgi:hypothetical protein